jgi:hypothetical protein
MSMSLNWEPYLQRENLANFKHKLPITHDFAEIRSSANRKCEYGNIPNRIGGVGPAP